MKVKPIVDTVMVLQEKTVGVHLTLTLEEAALLRDLVGSVGGGDINAAGVRARVFSPIYDHLNAIPEIRAKSNQLIWNIKPWLECII